MLGRFSAPINRVITCSESMDPELLTRWQALDIQLEQELARLRQLEEEAQLLLYFHNNFRRTNFRTTHTTRFSTEDTYYPPITHSPSLPSPLPSPKSPRYRPLPPFQDGPYQEPPSSQETAPSTPDPRSAPHPSLLRRHT